LEPWERGRTERGRREKREKGGEGKRKRVMEKGEKEKGREGNKCILLQCELGGRVIFWRSQRKEL
jgi:hypothetical protein